MKNKILSVEYKQWIATCFLLTPYFIQFLSNTAVISVIIFIPLIAKEYGANSPTIGGIVAGYNGMLFLSSALFGRWADLKGRKQFIVLGLFLSGIVFILHLFASNLYLLFLIRCIAGLVVGIFPASIVAYVYKKENNLGFFTATASLGWGVGSVVAGIIADYHKNFIFAGLCFFLIFFIALLFLKPKYNYIKQPFFNLEILRRNWRVYLIFFLRHSGASNIWVIYPLFLSHIGANKFWIGIIYCINSFGQVIFMPCLGKVNSIKLIKMGIYFSATTFIGFGLCRTFHQILPLQIILAFSWSCICLGTLKYLLENNEESSTVVGIFNSLTSLSSIVGALLGGVVAIFGYPAVMYTAALLTLSGSFIFLPSKLWKKQA